MRTADDGTVTLWLLGLCMAVLLLGGLSLDLWRAFNERRALAGAVDAAAVAGASGLDEDAFRRDGSVLLDPALAERLAAGSLLAQDPTPALTGWQARATAEAVTVTATGEVELTLLRLLAPDQAPLAIEVSATVTPRGSR